MRGKAKPLSSEHIEWLERISNDIEIENNRKSRNVRAAIIVVTILGAGASFLLEIQRELAKDETLFLAVHAFTASVVYLAGFSFTMFGIGSTLWIALEPHRKWRREFREKLESIIVSLYVSVVGATVAMLCFDEWLQQKGESTAIMRFFAGMFGFQAISALTMLVLAKPKTSWKVQILPAVMRRTRRLPRRMRKRLALGIKTTIDFLEMLSIAILFGTFIINVFAVAITAVVVLVFVNIPTMAIATWLNVSATIFTSWLSAGVLWFSAEAIMKSRQSPEKGLEKLRHDIARTRVPLDRVPSLYAGIIAGNKYRSRRQGT